ncbi:hypothetical protein AAHB66_10375 [Leclercia sp. S52]|uniref:hypothetical protein n=1 Tax=Leclercia sp. S52 TaxID=3138178 RepID=UPI00321B2302
MIDVNLLFKNEKVEDIITFFAGFQKSIGYASLDRYFVRYRFNAIETGEFMKTFHELCEKGIVSLNDRMGGDKRPELETACFCNSKKIWH